MASAPPRATFSMIQRILDGSEQEINRGIPTKVFAEGDRNSDILTVFDDGSPLGISPGFSPSGNLVALAIANAKECRIVTFQEPSKRRGQTPKPLSEAIVKARVALQEKVLCRPDGEIYAFDMGPLSMSLYTDIGVRINNAVDIQSAFSAIDRKPIFAMKAALGDSVKIIETNVRDLFLYPVYEKDDRHRVSDIAMRAWISQFLPSFNNGAELFEKVKRIDTKKFSPQRLNMIAKAATDSTRLDQKKPIHKTHTGKATVDQATGEMRLEGDAYNARLRPSSNRVNMDMDSAAGMITLTGQVSMVSGRTTNVNVNGHSLSTDKTVMMITSIGRDDNTSAEAKRAATVLRILQGSEQLLETSPWMKNIWFVNDCDQMSWPAEWLESSKNQTPTSMTSMPKKELNASQQKAVMNMLSEVNARRITLIQGPPGSGKTSVISYFVMTAVGMGRSGIWLVAQSNVAVKNIALKLMADGFKNWKLLVSKDYHFDWHEHQYDDEIKTHLIRSDSFRETSKAKLRGVHVVLCTLSMLSNNNINKFNVHIPLKTLVVDEASQIEVGDYISIFSAFKNTLRKVCFIGDDKQLPPFGQEDIQDLQSIFEVTHLRKNAVFLDTQYRMPPQIGRIISDAVYNGNLKSNPKHPIPDQIIACHFINVPGKEKQLPSMSYVNELECEMILKIARKFEEEQKNYRIITPYGDQRNLIESSMKEEGLRWEDKCFNVDSFQGNEDDYILISVVRTRQIGFLQSLRRTNVMLSRCKKGMYIVSNQQFLEGKGADTLVGTFLKEMGSVWLTENDVEGENFVI